MPPNFVLLTWLSLHSYSIARSATTEQWSPCCLYQCYAAIIVSYSSLLCLLAHVALCRCAPAQAARHCVLSDLLFTSLSCLVFLLLKAFTNCTVVCFICVQVFEAATDAGADDIVPATNEDDHVEGYKVKPFTTLPCMSLARCWIAHLHVVLMVSCLFVCLLAFLYCLPGLVLINSMHVRILWQLYNLACYKTMLLIYCCMW